MTPTSSRTPREMFTRHGTALAAGDLDEIAIDYAENSVLLADLPDTNWDLQTQLFDDDVLFLRWSADHAVRYTPRPKD